MKAMIDRHGNLWLERAGKLKPQSCPLKTTDHRDEGAWCCGDWCPLFGVSIYPDRSAKLHLCHADYGVVLTDERQLAKGETTTCQK
jgi:hypothetical protein